MLAAVARSHTFSESQSLTPGGSFCVFWLSRSFFSIKYKTKFKFETKVKNELSIKNHYPAIR